MTPQDLLDHFSTQAAIAEFFEISESAVSRWFSDNLVPLGRQYEAQVRTAGKLSMIGPPSGSKGAWSKGAGSKGAGARGAGARGPGSSGAGARAAWPRAAGSRSDGEAAA